MQGGLADKESMTAGQGRTGNYLTLHSQGQERVEVMAAQEMRGKLEAQIPKEGREVLGLPGSET